MPNLVALGMVIVGIVIAALGDGVLHGSLLGGFVAAAGLIPACYAAWKGTQQKEQGQMAGAIIMIFVSLGVAGALIVLRLIHYVR